MAEIGSFKSKLFGGFDRKDVVNYIEKLAAERNEYIVKCRDLEVKVQELEGKIEDIRSEYERKISEVQAENESKIEEITSEYEMKLTEAEAAIVCANLKAEEKRTTEREEALKVLGDVVDRFEAAGSDTVLLCSRIVEDLKETANKIEGLPDIVVSAKERIDEIKSKIN